MLPKGSDRAAGRRLPDSGTERRLHPLSWMFVAASSVKGLILPLVFLLFASGGSNYEIWASVFIIPATIVALVRYVAYRYRFDEEELVIRDGILTRNERHIPYDRVQNIDLIRNPMHRILDVAHVRLETASGGKPEAVIRVLSTEAVEEMRSRIFNDRGIRPEAAPTQVEEVGGCETSIAQTDSAADKTDLRGSNITELNTSALAHWPSVQGVVAETLLRVGPMELVRLGLISNRGMVVVAAVMGIFWQTQWWDLVEWNDIWQRYTGAQEKWLSALVQEQTWIGSAIVLLGGLLAFFILLRAFSVSWHLIKLYGFTLSQRGRDLRAEYGLFTRISATIPTARIQLVSTRQTFLHRCFGRVSVELETAGGSGNEDGEGNGGRSQETQWLAPILEEEAAGALIEQVLPGIDVDNVQWKPLAPGAQQRLLRRGMASALLGGALSVFLLGSWSLAFVGVLSCLAWVHARQYVRHTAWALASWGVLFRSGWWDRRMSFVRFSKVQSVEVGESPFDRRHGMASLSVDTAGALKLSHSIDIPYLYTEVASEIRDRLYSEAARTSFRW